MGNYSTSWTHCTVCPGSSDPILSASYIKRDTTSWTHSSYNVDCVSKIVTHFKYCTYVQEEFWPILCTKLVNELGQNFLDSQQMLL